MKKQARQNIKSRIEMLTESDILHKSAKIFCKLSEFPEFLAARVVMLYMPIPGEVSTEPIARACFQAGKVVVVPRPCPATRKMTPVVCDRENISDFDPSLGLRSPAGQEIVEPENIDLIIVPGIAFDRNCNRLGRGGGFYDRFLDKQNCAAFTVGLAFTEQILPILPIDKHDKPVDAVITDIETFLRPR